MLWSRNDEEEIYEQPDDDYLASPQSVVEQETEEQEDDEDDDLWRVAFREACSARGSLQATPQQVLDRLSEKEEEATLDRPTKYQVVLWKKDNNDVAVSSIVEAYRRKRDEEQPSSSWLSRVASTLYNTVVASPKHEEEDWTAGQDDYRAEQPVDWSQAICNIELAVQCVEKVMTKDVRVLKREGQASNCFLGWIHENFKDDLLSKLGEDEINMVMEVLKELQQVRVVDDELLILGPPQSAAAASDDVLAARFRLNCAIQQLEASIDGWTVQRDAALVRAKKQTKKNQKKAAMAELRRKALYDTHLERAHVTLLNLEQTREAIDTAQSQAQLTQVLQTTTSVLQSLNQKVSLDQVEEASTNLAEEYQHLNQVNETLAAHNDTLVGTDDDDLLKELEALTMQDESQFESKTVSANDSDDMSAADDESNEEAGTEPSLGRDTEPVSDENMELAESPPDSLPAAEQEGATQVHQDEGAPSPPRVLEA